MIKFLGMGKKKPETVKKIGKGFIPTDKVKDMSKKGFSEPEIIDVLRKEGFSSEEIDSALTQALKVGVTGEEIPEKLPTLQELQAQQAAPPAFPGMEQSKPQIPQIPEPSMEYPQPQYYPTEDYSSEELIESIVQERMSELDQKLTDFKAKYAVLERKMADLHHQLSTMSKGRSETEEKILNKIDSFRDTLASIDGRISSLEKAFKEALPALIESVRSLTDLVQRIKKES